MRKLKSDFIGAKLPDTVYGREMRDLLVQQTGADKVITFGTIVRQTKPQDGNYQPPATDVHVDWTARRAHILAKDLLSKSDTPQMQYTRFICINLWRAISSPPQDYPLAVCDARSLSSTVAEPNIMIHVDQIPPDLSKRELLPDGPIASEAELFTFDDQQQWFYFSDMKEDEVLLFKLYDSENYEQRRCPHTSFLNNTENAKPRESVEIRSVVYFK